MRACQDCRARNIQQDNVISREEDYVYLRLLNEEKVMVPKLEDRTHFIRAPITAKD